MNVNSAEQKPAVAAGAFDVKISPPEALAVPDGAPQLTRHRIEKTYSGGLAGRATGEMIAGGQPQQGQAAYAALESFVGTLDGRSGGFALAHLGEMATDGETLRIVIVPGSGSGELVGIRGELQLRREGGAHYYALNWWIA